MIHENTDPGATETNNFNKASYDEPCPPSGTHRYFFKLYALDPKPWLSQGCSKIQVERKMVGHIIEQTELLDLIKEYSTFPA